MPINAQATSQTPTNHWPFGSAHPQGAQFAFADGHVEWMREDIDYLLFERLATKADDD
jgi:prepilin-type processing-associated H-X9-DG protein